MFLFLSLFLSLSLSLSLYIYIYIFFLSFLIESFRVLVSNKIFTEATFFHLIHIIFHKSCVRCIEMCRQLECNYKAVRFIIYFRTREYCFLYSRNIRICFVKNLLLCVYMHSLNHRQ